MVRTRIKICGIRDAQAATAAVDAGADAIGLVFAPASRRCVTVDQVKQVLQALPAFVEPVGLFVDAAVEQVRQTALSLGLRTVQLHGRETPQEADELRPLRVIKAIGFDTDGLADRLAGWRAIGDRLGGLLWDAPDQSSGDQPNGGSGRRFDWETLNKLQSTGALDGLPPTVLAGGLTPDNVGEAIGLVGPYGVDVSSGVESTPGVKDPVLIRAFCQAVRRADTAHHHQG